MFNILKNHFRFIENYLLLLIHRERSPSADELELTTTQRKKFCSKNDCADTPSLNNDINPESVVDDASERYNNSSDFLYNKNENISKTLIF